MLYNQDNDHMDNDNTLQDYGITMSTAKAQAPAQLGLSLRSVYTQVFFIFIFRCFYCIFNIYFYNTFFYLIFNFTNIIRAEMYEKLILFFKAFPLQVFIALIHELFIFYHHSLQMN